MSEKKLIINDVPFTSLLVAELKSELARRGLPTSGNKIVLQRRLKARLFVESNQRKLPRRVEVQSSDSSSSSDVNGEVNLTENDPPNHKDSLTNETYESQVDEEDIGTRAESVALHTYRPYTSQGLKLGDEPTIKFELKHKNIKTEEIRSTKGQESAIAGSLNVPQVIDTMVHELFLEVSEPLSSRDAAIIQQIYEQVIQKEVVPSADVAEAPSDSNVSMKKCFKYVLSSSQYSRTDSSVLKRLEFDKQLSNSSSKLFEMRVEPFHKDDEQSNPFIRRATISALEEANQMQCETSFNMNNLIMNNFEINYEKEDSSVEDGSGDSNGKEVDSQSEFDMPNSDEESSVAMDDRDKYLLIPSSTPEKKCRIIDDSDFEDACCSECTNFKDCQVSALESLPIIPNTQKETQTDFEDVSEEKVEGFTFEGKSRIIDDSDSGDGCSSEYMSLEDCQTSFLENLPIIPCSKEETITNNEDIPVEVESCTNCIKLKNSQTSTHDNFPILSICQEITSANERNHSYSEEENIFEDMGSNEMMHEYFPISSSPGEESRAYKRSNSVPDEESSSKKICLEDDQAHTLALNEENGFFQIRIVRRPKLKCKCGIL